MNSKTEIERVEKALRKANYTIDRRNSTLTLRGGIEKKTIATIGYDKEKLINCCGVDELGNLSFPVSKILPGHMVAVRLFIKFIFLSEKDHDMDFSTNIPTGSPLIFVSNNEDGWELIEPVILKMPKHFQHVSTTRNGVGGNVLKMFVGKY